MYLGYPTCFLGSQALKEDTLETPPKKNKSRSRSVSEVDDTDALDESQERESHCGVHRTRPSP